MESWILAVIATYVIFSYMRNAIEEKDLIKLLFYTLVLLICNLYRFRQYDAYETSWKACMLTLLGMLFAFLFHQLVKADRKWRKSQS